jgi:phosphoribosyl 1,2-cyclic phosphodiesterase
MFKTRFWGVRGTIACPYDSYMKYGGNTSCVTVQCDDTLLIFDSGTGILPLGNKIMANGTGNGNISVFFSHTHWDHISGFPFFKPAYSPQFSLDLYCGNLKKHGSSIFEVLSHQMANPTFPVPIDILQAKMQYHDFDAGESIKLSDEIHLDTCLLNHPKGATGYRVNFKGRSVCYVTDTEHKKDTLDESILKLVENTDLFIYDSTYTEEEYPNFEGWGHSTWQEGVRLSKEAGVRNYAIFHHDPSHDDDFMDNVERDAKKTLASAFVAKEGMEIEFNSPGGGIKFGKFDDKP